MQHFETPIPWAHVNEYVKFSVLTVHDKWELQVKKIKLKNVLSLLPHCSYHNILKNIIMIHTIRWLHYLDLISCIVCQ